jgi:integrase
MPLALKPPRPGKTPYWSVRGTYFGISMDRSTKTPERTKAAKLLARWKDEPERGVFAKPGEPTFVDAATNYIAATGIDRFTKPLVEHFGYKALRLVDQKEIDAAAAALYPQGSPATRNRQVYTPVSAILKHAGIEMQIRRPRGAQGRQRAEWLWPQQAFAVFKVADTIDAEFGLLLRMLTYTGMRLGDGLGCEIDHLELAGSFQYLPTTKNGRPRGVHLPPTLVAALANHPRGIDRPGERIFRFHKGGRLYAMLRQALTAAGVAITPRTGFHLLCHTWATWMRRYGGLDTRGLVGTGRWQGQTSAAIYEHVVATEEAMRADLLPVEVGGMIERGEFVDSPASAIAEETGHKKKAVRIKGL